VLDWCLTGRRPPVGYGLGVAAALLVTKQPHVQEAPTSTWISANLNCGTALPSGSVETDCAICREGAPRDVIGELSTVWISAPRRAALPGYVCVVAKRHVEEPFQLVGAEFTAFWSESMAVAAALYEFTRPLKMNYEIHGNTIPHLHLHLHPRFAGDPFQGQPIDGTTTAFTRTPQDIERLQAAIARLVQAP
jgi:diadenosine tetraphosphate (Ap4A) HIT family hydrolase